MPTPSKIIVPGRKLTDREKHVALQLFIEGYKAAIPDPDLRDHWDNENAARECVRAAITFCAVEGEEVPQ